MPILSDLWLYHHVFYEELEEEERENFAFGEEAGVLSEGENNRLFAVCLRAPLSRRGLERLPGGTYLCCQTEGQNVGTALRALEAAFAERGLAFPARHILEVRLVGMLKWEYEVQVFLAGADGKE